MKYLFLTFLLMTSAFAKEGGNGGGVHDCGTTVELYDFFEGKHPLLHGISVWTPESGLSEADYLVKAMAHLKKDLPYAHSLIASRLLDFMTSDGLLLFQDKPIPLISDADVPFVEKGCSYRQVANWNERFGRVFIDQTIYDRLDGMNRAGLILHEVIYKMARDNGKANLDSNKVRRVIAKIFSEEKLTEADERDLHSSYFTPVEI